MLHDKSLIFSERKIVIPDSLHLLGADVVNSDNEDLGELCNELLNAG